MERVNKKIEIITLTTEEIIGILLGYVKSKKIMQFEYLTESNFYDSMYNKLELPDKFEVKFTEIITEDEDKDE